MAHARSRGGSIAGRPLARTAKVHERAAPLDGLLARSTTVAAALVDRDGAVVWANTTFRRVVGEVDSVADAIAAGQEAVLATLLEQAGASWRSSDAGLAGSDGTIVDCTLSALARGKRVLLVAERLIEPADRLNSHLLELNDELLAARRELATSNRKLRELDELKNMFIASATHDLKTPIASIVGYSELLGEEDLGATAEPMVATIERNARRLVSMIDDLLGAALVITGELRLERAPVDAAALLRDAVAMIQPTAAAAGIDVQLDVCGHVPAFLDARRVLQILDNLLSNAVKYSPDGGRVGVSLRADDAITIAVSDSGIGISPEEQARLFTRFFRASTARERGIAGTGLGLANARAFAEAHGGRLECTSEIGSGSTFTLVLPPGEADS